MTTQVGVKQATEGWRLRNWRVRARLVALILVPTAAAVLLGGIQVLGSAAAASDYARTNQFAWLSAELGELTHLVSAERARTAWYIARNRPADAFAEVQSHMAQVDLAAKQVRAIAQDLLPDSTGRTADQLENLLNRLNDLTSLRRQAHDANLLAGPAVELYTVIVGDLLSVHNELVKGSVDDELLRQTRMLDGLVRAKESVSYQQALIIVALVEGSFEPEPLKRLLGEQSREANERKDFAAEATAEERRIFDETVNGHSAERMLFLRELVLIRATTGLPLRGLDLTRKDDAREWFEASSVVLDSMRKVEQRQAQGIVQRSQALSADERQRAVVTAIAVLALLVAVLLITTGVARSLVRPLRRLRSEALEIAGRRLPEFVQHLRESRDGAVNVEVPPIGIFTKDEVGEVARAFDEVHREAVRLAGDEAKLRSNVNAMFVNLSRRSQTLVERQLTLIEKLERGERDDARLGDLFKLDHLATRMRRNSENLLVLAGQEAARKWSEPVELMDVVRAALGEVESYDRVSVQVQSDVAIAGQAVTDVVHLLAELVENAVSFSPGDTKVIISSSRIDGGGLLLSVTDHGIGMTQEELAEANWRLAHPPVVDVSVSRRMGLFVVGRLALRHSIKVRLRLQDTGGLTAMVLVPPALLTGAPGPVPGTGQRPRESRQPHIPAHAASPAPAYPAPSSPAPSSPASPPSLSGGHSSVGFSADPAPSYDGLALHHGTAGQDTAEPSWFGVARTPAHAGERAGAEPPAWPDPMTAPSSEPGISHEPAAREHARSSEPVTEVSGWFSRSAPTADHRDQPWTSAAGQGLQAAGAAAEPIRSGTTNSGLPKRTPRANLVPGTANPKPPPVPAPPVSPDRLRSRLADYQQGVRKGRAELEEDA